MRIIHMKYTIAKLHSLLKNKELTSVEITKEYIKKIEKDKFNIFITKTPEIAIERAKNADKMIREGKIGPMSGIPVGIKDIFCTKNVPTTCCSKMLHNFIPNYESTVTQKLIDCGAVMLGKLNMDEFAMGSANINSYFGPVKNPWGIEKDLVPGGSSGGSAAAISAGLCPGSLGSDTGGSVRQPAAFCGTVGVKPTYGRCSRWGMIAFASSLDQAGVFTNTVEDAALMLQAICSYDGKDSTSSKTENFQIKFGDNLKGKRIGIPKEYNIEDIPGEIIAIWQKGAEWLKSAGAEIIEISLPHTKYALPAYYVISPAEASSNLARYDGVRYGLSITGKNIEEMYELTRAEGFGKEVKKRILIGTYALSSKHYQAYYKKAQYLRGLIKTDFTNVFKKVDAILTPTTPTEAFNMNDKPDSLMMYINDIFTVPINLAGLPAISVPAGLSQNSLPLGLQVVANSFDEQTMFAVAKILENSSDLTQPS
ncbi:MAG: Asp-tRNA(Asn)/Glu-tRNA(Gln) amidotransferase subunit GatA [Rickettsiaceae bacterium H1]|nr:Asp-tRNA(Asn)/Glu-tRNA(Gln) amidotransferase subunit GatA [Rickettsiaceae bacterium H1]